MRLVRRIAPAAIVAVVLVILVVFPDMGPEKYRDLPSMFRIESRRQACAGIAVAAVQDGRIVYSAGFGLDGVRRPVTADTPLYLGPASEALTGAALYSLVLDRTLSADTLVAGGAASSQRNLSPSSGESPSTPRALRPGRGVPDPAQAAVDAWNGVTVAGLITRDPVPEYDLPGGTVDYEAGFGIPGTTPEDILAGETARGARRMGRVYRALGLLMERTTGRSFHDLLIRRVTGPLGMDSTHAVVPSQGSIPRGNGLFFGMALPHPARAVPRIAIPSDGIISTANDMALFVAYLAAPRSRGIPSLPSRAVPALYQPLREGSSFAWGWRIQERDGDRVIFQGGTLEGFSSSVVVWPERRSGLVILSAQGGIVQSSLVLPLLVSTAERIMFDGSAARPLPLGRALILLGCMSFMYLLVLGLQIGGSYGWARGVRDRAEARGSLGPVVFARARSLLGCGARVGLLILVPFAAGFALGRPLSFRSLFVLEPGLAAVLAASCFLGVLRNVSRIVWLADAVDRDVFVNLRRNTKR